MNEMILSVSPHVRSGRTTRKIMLDVLIALCPAVVASVLFFGFRALLVEVVCVAAAVASEWVFEKGCKKTVTVSDLSAAVTGLLLALSLPVGIPLWQAVVGSVAAIVVVKQLFGGIGHNFANPAVTARVIMFLAFSSTMATWAAPNFVAVPGVDAVSAATPLATLKDVSTEGMSALNLFLGTMGGCLGETSALALLLGGIYLLARKVISWYTPVAFIGTVFVLSLIRGGFVFAGMEVLTGGLILSAIFMATDYATTPFTPAGKLIFGVGCGLITCVIRFFGSYPEGVSFSILLMNIATPYICKWTESKPLGGAKA